MNKKKNRAEFAASLDRRLSGLRGDPRLAQRIIANEEGKSGMKKCSRAVVLAVVLALALTSVTFAATGGFGILNFHPEQAENTGYIEHIVAVGQSWEDEYFTASVNEAVFDGSRLSLTLSIFPKKENEPVYVIPRIKAAANGQELSVFQQRARGGYDPDGFWIPDMEPGHISCFEQIGIDVLISEDGWNNQIVQDAVTWELTFDVLHPEWPIAYTEQDEPGMDGEEWSDEEFDAYLQQFAEAYTKKIILLNRGAMLSPFAAADPAYDISLEDTMEYVDWSEALLTQEAFKLTDRITFRFTTDPLPVKTAKEAVAFDLADGLHVELTELNVSASQIFFTFRVTNADPGVPLTMDDWRGRAFAILADNAETEYVAGKCGRRDDGSVTVTGQCTISGETSILTVIPVEAGQANSIMRDRVIPDDLQGNAVVIELE